jgi:hypothetical protein
MINVYWTCTEKNWLMAEEPVNIYQEYVAAKDKSDGAEHCPAIRDHLKTTYGIKSMYDYEVRSTELGEFYSPDGNDEFFREKILVRSAKDGLISFKQNFLFFTDAPSLIMTGQIFPYLEHNSVTDTCRPIPGQFDIGKWFRPLEFSAYISGNSFRIKRGEIYQYVRFDTDDKIRMQKFIPTDKIHFFLQSCVGSVDPKNRWKKPLDFFYKNFTVKEQILAEIRQNLC